MFWRGLLRFVRSLHGWRLQFVAHRAVVLGTLALALVTFTSANVHAVLWSQSQWLVSAVLPAVVVDLTNEERATAPLSRNPILDQAATMKAEHMAQLSYFSHYAPDGTSPWHWFDTAGYRYQHAGENLAVFFTDSRAVVEAWMASPGHRKNILDPKFSEIGVGTARGVYEGHETIFVVQLFGTPRASVPRSEQEPTLTTETETTPTPAETTAPAATATITPVVEAALASAPFEQTKEVEVVPVESTNDETPARATTSLVTDELVLTDPVQERPLPVATTATTAVDSLLAHPVSKYEVVSAYEQTPLLGTLATQPSRWLSYVYTMLALILLASIVGAASVAISQRRWYQLGTEVALAGVLVALWYVHESLTAGALVAGISSVAVL